MYIRQITEEGLKSLGYTMNALNGLIEESETGETDVIVILDVVKACAKELELILKQSIISIGDEK